MIYLDNAATSFPKPDGVVEAMARFMKDIGANPGRAAHRLSVEAGRAVLRARETIAELFHVRDSLRVVFTANATEGLNLVLKGFLRPGDHVVTSSMEHNSVMRPLRELERLGVLVSVVACARNGCLDPRDVTNAVRRETRLIVLNHASNVTGTILPVEQVGALAREEGIYLAVDAAQTAGILPIDPERAGIDFLIFSGHKGLCGPPGTGGLVLGERVDPARVAPLKTGGTGSRSAEAEQPDFLPDRYESGTLNTVGLVGLGAGARFVLEQGTDRIRSREADLLALLLDGLAGIDGVTVQGPRRPDRVTSIVSFTVSTCSPSEAAVRLEEGHDIMCRVGLHCAPMAHRTLGTYPGGTVRFSLGCFSKESDIQAALEGVRSLVR